MLHVDIGPGNVVHTTLVMHALEISLVSVHAAAIECVSSKGIGMVTTLTTAPTCTINVLALLCQH